MHPAILARTNTCTHGEQVLQSIQGCNYVLCRGRGREVREGERKREGGEREGEGERERETDKEYCMQILLVESDLT